MNRPGQYKWTGADQKAYRLRKLRGETLWLDATGTARRIRALYAIGWTAQHIADRLGISDRNAARIARMTRVNARTAAAIRRVYDELSNTPGPSPITAARAAAAGWLKPGWWDDDTIDDPNFTPAVQVDDLHWSDIDHVAVERACQGDHVRLTRAERREVVRVLTERGVSAKEIAAIVATTPRNVVRDRAA